MENKKEVKCSFCGNDTSCATCAAGPAADAEHACHDCYQKMGGQLPENVRDRTHVCFSQERMQEEFESFLNQATERGFSQLWDSEKRKLKDMSRQELSRTSFFEGARFMFSLLQHLEKGGQEHSGEK